MKEFYSSEEWQQMEWGHPGGGKSTQWLLERADLQTGSHILDLCCGRGDAAEVILGETFRKKAFRMTGVDISEASVIEAKKRYGHKFHYHIGDGRGIPLENRAADAVLCECSLSLFGGDIPKVLEEAARALKTGGCLMLSDLYAINQEELVTANGNKMVGGQLYTKQGWLTCLSEAGFLLQEWKDISGELRSYCMEYLWKTGNLFPACAHGFGKGTSLSGLGYFLGIWRSE